MERRARRWRLPLAARIGAVPVLVAVAGALAFGFFSQSTAAPAISWGTEASMTWPNRQMLLNWPKNGDMPAADIRIKSSQVCVPRQCDNIQGTIRIYVQMDGRPAGTKYSAQIKATDGLSTYIHGFKIPGSEFSTPGFGFIHYEFGGSSGFGPSSDAERIQVKAKYSGNFRVDQSSTTSDPGEKVDFTATYSGGDTVPDSPTGTLKLQASDGQKVTEVETANVTGKTVKFSTTKLPAGTRLVSVKYSGDAKFEEFTSSSLSHTVTDGVATTTTLTVSPNPVVSGTALQMKVKVAAKSGTAAPTGKYVIQTGPSSSVEGPLPANGIAELDITPSATGERVFFASYEPSGKFAASRSADLKVTVLKGDTTTVLTAQPEAATPGKPVKLSAKVGPAPGRSIAFPQGTVSFTAGDTKLGTCTLQNLACEISTDKLPLGKSTVTAAYSGGPEDNKSAGTVDVRVSVGSTTKLTVAPAAVTVGSAVALNALVAGADPKITAPLSGKVTFLDGTTELGKADVDKTGKATFSSTNLAVGTHSLTARFEGSDALDASTSEKVSVQVNAASTPGQGGGSQGGSQSGSQGGGNGGSQNGGTGGSNPQPKNLASTGASIAQPIGIGALLLILGAVTLTLGRRRRHRRAR